MANIMENTPFLFFVAIMQPLLFMISWNYFGLNGTAFITAILIIILILYFVRMWYSGKIPFASDEE